MLKFLYVVGGVLSAAAIFEVTGEAQGFSLGSLHAALALSINLFQAGFNMIPNIGWQQALTARLSVVGK